MKFRCEQSSLIKALNTVSKAVSNRTTKPILKGILIEAKDNALNLTAYDEEMFIEKKINAAVDEEGSVVVFAKLFSDIIRKLPSGEIYFEENNSILSIKNRGSEFNVTGISSDEFPHIKKSESEFEEFSLSKEVFSKMVNMTAFSASIDSSKGVMIGIFTEIKDGFINMVSLDGYRMAVVREKLDVDTEKSFIISARILSEVSKIAAEIENEDNVSVSVGKNEAFVDFEDTKIALRMLEGDFIKYRDFLPKEKKLEVLVNKKEFEESLERAALVAREGKNNLLKLRIFENIMNITSRSEEGNVKEELEVRKQGEDIEIGFNSKYLLDALKVISDENIKLEMSTSVGACMIKPESGNEFDYLVLPVRI